MRRMFTLLVVAVVLLVGFSVVRSLLLDRRGDVYAFDMKDGSLLWHNRFPGVAASMVFVDGTVSVRAYVAHACDDDDEGGDWVVTRFDRRTGREVRLVPGGAGEPGVPDLIYGTRGVVAVRGHAWRAHVSTRWGQDARRSHGVLFVAVDGQRATGCGSD